MLNIFSCILNSVQVSSPHVFMNSQSENQNCSNNEKKCFDKQQQQKQQHTRPMFVYWKVSEISVWELAIRETMGWAHNCWIVQVGLIFIYIFF